MINSLSKDSHITHGASYIRRSAQHPNACQNSGQATTAYKCEIKNKQPAEPSFCGLFNAKKFYKSSALKNTLKFAADQQLVFAAAFSLFLTCVMRPASIMVVPSKKNKDDQTYASAHSIASGIIGFAITTVVFTPFSSGIKKFAESTAKIIEDKSHYLLKDKKALNTAKIYLDRLPDLLGAIPKGLLTIALIPPILKYVFGMEKKGATPENNIKHLSVNYSLLNFKSANITGKDQFASFKGGMN